MLSFLFAGAQHELERVPVISTEVVQIRLVCEFPALPDQTLLCHREMPSSLEILDLIETTVSAGETSGSEAVPCRVLMNTSITSLHAMESFGLCCGASDEQPGASRSINAAYDLQKKF
ncbi:hypothetical protein V5799_009438 [Amblyomma americanum]|uniref:Uncharacterized protein n=1 Tax=Amblyomma americanum TaxID=6943 RepID=A0AAQ4FBN2_AMBAM